MKPQLVGALLLSLVGPAWGQTAQSLATFDKLVKNTYNFNPVGLPPKQIPATEKKVDVFWNTVKAQKARYLPCLRTRLKDPKSNPFFRFDSSNLLVTLDPSTASKALQVQIYTVTDLAVANPQRWLLTLAGRGKEGFDISTAATRWLTDPKAHYTLPEHGDYNINHFAGALFLFGSEDERFATPVLIKMVNNPKDPNRESALSILADQATPAAYQTINALDANTFSPQFKDIIENYRTYEPRIQPRAKPLNTRAEFLKAFEELVDGNGERFMKMVENVGDGEKDAVAVMKPEDLPLLRRVRRTFASFANPHALDYYNNLTDIIITMTEPEQASDPAILG